MERVRDREALLEELVGNGVLPDSMRGRLLRTREVALLFQVSERAVTDWARRGRIPSVRTPGAPPLPGRRGLGPPAAQRGRRVASSRDRFASACPARGDCDVPPPDTKSCPPTHGSRLATPLGLPRSGPRHLLPGRRRRVGGARSWCARSARCRRPASSSRSRAGEGRRVGRGHREGATPHPPATPPGQQAA